MVHTALPSCRFWTWNPHGLEREERSYRLNGGAGWKFWLSQWMTLLITKVSLFLRLKETRGSFIIHRWLGELWDLPEIFSKSRERTTDSVLMNGGEMGKKWSSWLVFYVPTSLFRQWLRTCVECWGSWAHKDKLEPIFERCLRPLGAIYMGRE